MKHIALICWIGACILLAGCPPIAPPPSPPPTLAQTCDHTSSGSAFVSAKVFKLKASFDPMQGVPPSGQDILGNVAPSDPYWNDFVAAFGAANDSFKDKLCGLDAVFVVQSTCTQQNCQVDDVINHSWGFRQQTLQPKRFIATSETLWQGGSAPVFANYENLRLEAVVEALDRLNGANWFRLANLRPQFQSASPNTSAMTLLAILAHEYGHVYWYDAFVSPPGGSFNANATGFCGGGFYTANSWGTGNHSITVPSTRWIEFGQRFPTQIHNPDLSGTLLTHLSQGNFGSAGSDLSAIFLNGDLAGTLASFSAIEDFVETYEWYQLTHANPPLTDLTIQIDSRPQINVVRFISNKPGVKRKMACFSSG